MTQQQGQDWYHLSPTTRDQDDAASTSTRPPYEYPLEDAFSDTSPVLDAWSEYLRTRYTKRKELYESLDTSAQELIRKEIRRIRYFREHFKDYRVFKTDDLPLVALLDDSRTKWRDIALKRSADEIAKCQKQAEKGGDTPNLARNRIILRYVQQWKKPSYTEAMDSISPDTYMQDLESGPVSSEDDPRKEDYGYNGWVIAWEQGKGWVSVDHPLVHGQFPHQKISIQQFLYNKEGTPLKRDTRKGQLRYFHLPANNMKWVEEAISRYYNEDNVEFDGKLVYNLKHNSQRLLRNELWRGQQRGGTNLPVHARQVTTRCSVVPSAPLPKAQKGKGDNSRKDVAIFLPFLHWEVEKRLQRMSQFVQVAKSRRDKLRRANTFRMRNKIADIAQKEVLKNARPISSFEADQRKRHLAWRPHHPLAKYFWHVAKLYQIIDEAADGRLIEDHLYNDPPLHMRRTLEQYYYWTAEDTTRRDRDQVVCRATRHYGDDNDPDSTSRIIMVDQLWLWILDDNTVISSFPRRWGRNKPDPSAVHRGIRDRLGGLDGDEIHSVYDIALIVVDECSKVFFDHTKPLDQRPELVDLFSSAISKIAEKKTIAYEGFGRDVSRISLDSLESAEKMLRRSLNIGFEWSILEEAQQVIDELQIMQEIYSQQISVMKDLIKVLNSLSTRAFDAIPGQDTDGRKQAMDRVKSTVADITQRRDELISMERLQTKTRSQLRELLDMKQQQANIIEAKAAIRRADESVLQGRSIVVFTVVTIFFLPLSFVTSVFGMNAREFSEDGAMDLSTQLKYMVGVSAAVIVISLSLAFSNWIRTVLHVGLSLVYVAVEDWLGWRNKKSNYNSTAIRNIQRERLKQLESRDHARRLTEINSRTSSAPGVRLQQRSTWDVRRLAGGPFRHFRRNKNPDNEESV
ncbi:unnamed protein product [Clonostachys chloroleuca]|uniref:Uncharacterized protein n=1 Tax=Clonostachys chloroleuca TaxID=1926264 RepID=A0AA35LSX1_9HYPO|nr:unnamed protein product [Clonostachys chloroleuca]